MVEEGGAAESPATVAEELMRPYVRGHPDDVEQLQVLATMAADVMRNATAAGQEQVIAEFSNTARALARFREEAAVTAITGGYTSDQSVVTREQILDELLADAEYARFQFFVAAAAADPELFREYLGAVDDQWALKTLREAATRAEQLNRPTREETVTAIYEAIVNEIPEEQRERVTNAFNAAHDAWRLYGAATMERVALFGYGQFPINGPVGAPPLTRVRISELIRNAEATPAGRELKRTLERRERAADAATWRFYVEAFAANPDIVKRLRKHGENEAAEALLDRNEYDSLIRQAAIQGERTLDLVRTDPDQLATEYPQLTEADRETMRVFAELATAVDGGEEPAREQAQAWYGMVVRTTAQLRRQEAAAQELRMRRRQPEPSQERLLADLNDDAERARFQFLLSAATADPEAYRDHVIRIPPTVVARAMVNRTLSAGQAARDRAERSELAGLIRVHQTVINAIPPDKAHQRERVTGAYRNLRGMLRKVRAASDEQIALARTVAGGELDPDRPESASPLTRAHVGELVDRARTSPAGRKLDRRAAHQRLAASGQLGTFLAEAMAAAPEATTSLLPPELRPVVDSPTFKSKVRRINRQTSDTTGGSGSSRRGRRSRPRSG